MKKLLSVLLATATAATACAGLAACEEPDNRTELIIWCPQAALRTYTELGEEFVTTYENGKYKDYRVTCAPHAEGDTKTELDTDPTAGGDVCFTEGGQLEKLEAAGYMEHLPAAVKTVVEGRDDPKAVATGTLNGNLVAFPATGDNTWFFWYDSNALTANDIKTFDGVFKKAKSTDKAILFSYNDGWYVSSWFMTAGCTMDYDAEKNYVTDINGAKGLKAAEALWDYIAPANNKKATKDEPVISPGNNDAFSTGAKNGTYIAGFSGSWMRSSLPANWVPAAKMPTYKIDGVETEVRNFATYKYAIVNKHRPHKDVAMELANFITSQKGQEKRASLTSAFPTNKAAAESDTVKNDPIAAAVKDRYEHIYEQKTQAAKFWDEMTAFGNKLAGTSSPAKSELQAAIDTLYTNIMAGETK